MLVNGAEDVECWFLTLVCKTQQLIILFHFVRYSAGSLLTKYCNVD